MQVLPNKPSWRLLGLAYLCAIVIGALAMISAKAYQAGFSGADEPSHFLNGYFVSTYLSQHLGTNPMGAATNFYIHYPKISIGHWPPAYYGFLGVLFLVLPPTIPVAFSINVLCAALPSIGVAAALGMLAGRRVALAGVLIYAVAPLVLEGHVMFMVDQPLTACLVAATAVWIAYDIKPTWGRAIGFAMLAAVAVLIKGNGWLVVLIPPFHIALTRDWKQLASLKLYVAAAMMAVIVVPWYVLTAKIAADGFNYHAGVDYALKALAANLYTIVQNLTWLGVPLLMYGIVAECRARHASPLRWRIVSGMMSLILATLVLQSLIPVDIVDRYMAPALPAVVAFTVLGVYHLMARLRTAAQPAVSASIGVLLIAALCGPGLMHLIERIPKADTRLAEVTHTLAASGKTVLTVIDGPPSEEGAFIAEMAVRDPALQGYVIRASALLADSNFMGTTYKLKFSGPDQVLGELNRLGVQHVVIVREAGRPAFAHSVQIRDALLEPNSGFHLTQRLPHLYRTGITELYDATGATTPDIAAVIHFGLPAKVSTLTQLQHQ